MRTLANLFIAALLTTTAQADLTVREIRYDGKLSDTEARFAVDFDAEATGADSSVTLFEGDVAVLTTKLPANLTLAREGQQYRLLAARPGRYKLKLDLVAKITRAEPWNSISFTGPVAAIASVNAQVAGAGVEVQLLAGMLQESGTKDNVTRVRGFLGAERTVSLRWQSRAAEVTRKALLTCETAAAVQITPTVIKYNTQLRYTILQGGTSRLTLTLPATQALTKLQGEQVRDWQTKVDGDRQLLTIEFIKPVEKNYALTLFSEQTVETATAAVTIAPPQPQEVERESGSLTVSAEDVLVETDSAAGLRQMNAPAGTLAAYQFYARPFTLALKLRRIEPVINATDRVAVRLEEARLLVTHTLTLSVEKAGIYAVELTPQAGFIVADVRGQGVEDWKATAGKLTVNFSSRLLGTRNLDVQLEQALKALPEKTEIAPLRVTGAAKETAQISAASVAGIQLKTVATELAGLREVPAAGDGSLAYFAYQPDWKLVLTPVRQAARVTADIFNLLTIGDGLVGGSATIRYAILNQGIPELRVKVPSHWKNVEFTGPNIRRKEQQGDTWVIGLQEKAWGGYTLVVTYDYQFDPHKAALPVAGIHVADIERETGSIAITSAANLQVVEAAGATAAPALRRIDELELSPNDRTLITRPVLLAYQYTGDSYQLNIEATRFEESPVLDAVADRTQLTTVLTDQGQMLTQASFMVKNNDRQFQRVKLPVGATLYSCFVSGLPAKPEKDGDELLIPLPRGVNRDQAFAVDILYEQKIGSLKSVLPHRIALVAPQTKMQTTYAEWELYVPTAYRLAGFGGNMIVARGTTYSVQDAWRRFIQFCAVLLLQPGFLLSGFLILLLLACGIATMMARRWAVGGAFVVLSCLIAVWTVNAVFQPFQIIGKLGQAGSFDDMLSGQRIAPMSAFFASELSDRRNRNEDQLTATEGEKIQLPMSVAGEPNAAAAPAASLDRSVGQRGLDGQTEIRNREAGRLTPAVPVLTEASPAKPSQPAFLDDVPSSGEVSAPVGGAGIAGGQMVVNGVHGIGATLPVAVAGIRPLRIELPRTGLRFVFTKVLNVRDEALSARAVAMESKVFAAVRGGLQAAAFVTGLALVGWQWRKLVAARGERGGVREETEGRGQRPRLQSLWITLGLALAIGAVMSLLISSRMLHWAMIALPPVIALVLMVWLVKRWIAKKKDESASAKASADKGDGAAGAAPSTGGVPPVVAALVLALIASTAVVRGSQDPVQTPTEGLPSRRGDLTVRPDGAVRRPAPSSLIAPNSGTATILSASYTGTVREVAAGEGPAVATVDAVLEVSATAAGQKLMLFGEEVAVQEFTAAPNTVKLVRDGKSVGVWLPKKGPATVRLKLLVKTGGDVAKRRLQFGLPPALASRLTVTLDEPDAAVEMPAAVALKTVPDGQKTRVEAVIGAADRAELSWTPRVKRATEIAATVFCQNASLVTIGSGVLNVRAVLDYQVTQGELRQMRVRLPAGQRLMRVEGDSIRTWKLDTEGAAQTLVVELVKGVTPGYRLTVETEKALGVKGELGRMKDENNLAVEIPHAVDVKRETGLVALRGAEELSLSVETTKELQKVDAEEFARALGASPVVPERPANDVAGGQHLSVTGSASGCFARNVVAGHTYRFEATGRIGVNIGAITVADPDGNMFERGVAAGRSTAKGGCPDSQYLCQGLWVASLVGKIGNDTCIQLGSHGSFQAPASGRLTLYINDCIYGDNSGAWDVTLWEEGEQVGQVRTANLAPSNFVLPTVANMSGVYRFLKPDFELAMRVEPMQPQIEAVVRNHMRVAAEQLSLSAQVDYTIKRAGVFVLKLALPAGYRIERVTGENIAQWVEKTEKDARLLEVTLKERTTGTYCLKVDLMQFTHELAKSVAVAGVHPLGTQKLNGFVGVSAEEGVQVKADAFDGLTEIPPAQTGLPDGVVLAYKFIQTDPASAKATAGKPQLVTGWKATVATEQLEAWVRAEVVHWVTLTETLASTRALVRYDVQNAPTKEFRLKVPATAKNVEITGANIRRKDEEAGDPAKNAGQAWRVELQNKVRGTYTLVVTWETPFDLKAGKLEVTGAEVVGVERETGTLAIIAPPTLQVKKTSASEDLLGIDARELPDWAGRPAQPPTLAYRYLRPGYKLALGVQRFEEAEVLQALVDSARLTTVVAEDGQMMTEMSLSVRNNARQYLEITLPAGAEVWSAFVAGQPVRPSIRKGKLLLPMERSASEQAVNVEVIYVGATRFPEASGRVALESPALDVPLKNARWELYLPPDYGYGDFAGTMQREIARAAAPVQTVSSFGWSEYAQEESKKQAERESDVKKDVSDLRSNLAGGNVKEAYGLYNRAKSKGPARRPDGNDRDELLGLEKQLKGAQARNLIQGQQALVDLNSAGVANQPVQIDKNRYKEEDAEQQWEKLQQAQEITVTKALPLHVNLPKRGLQYAFTQVLQTEVQKPMTVQFDARNTKGVSWPARIGLSVAGLAVLWWMVTGALAKREQ